VSPYTRVVQAVIRLVAFGAVVFSVCLLASDVFLYLSQRPASRPLILILKGLPFLAGIVLFWKSSDMAHQLTKDSD
jgi:hypothetical protein